jgi:hypothetical protein
VKKTINADSVYHPTTHVEHAVRRTIKIMMMTMRRRRKGRRRSEPVVD